MRFPARPGPCGPVWTPGRLGRNGPAGRVSRVRAAPALRWQRRGRRLPAEAPAAGASCSGGRGATRAERSGGASAACRRRGHAHGAQSASLRTHSWRAVTAGYYSTSRSPRVPHARRRVRRTRRSNRSVRPGAAAPNGWTASAAAAVVSAADADGPQCAAPLRFVAHTRCGCPRLRPRLRRDLLLLLHPPRRPMSGGTVHVGAQRCEGTRVHSVSTASTLPPLMERIWARDRRVARARALRMCARRCCRVRPRLPIRSNGVCACARERRRARRVRNRSA